MNCQKGRVELQYGLQISSKIPLALDHSIFVTVWLHALICFRVCFPRLPVISILPVPLFNRRGLGTRLVCIYICVVWW